MTANPVDNNESDAVALRGYALTQAAANFGTTI